MDNISYNDNIKMDVYDDFGKIGAMQSQWDDFVESAGSEIFSTYDWCRIWWKYYGNGRILRIFVFSCGGKLVGLLPTFIEKICVVKVVGIVGTQYAFVEFSPPILTQYMRRVVEQWLDRLYLEFKPDIICLGPISGVYDKTEQLACDCISWNKYGYVTEKRNAGVQTVFKLGADINEYLAGLAGKERHEVNRSYRNLLKIANDNNAPLVNEFVSAAHINSKFDDFIQMHNHHWQQIGQAGHFNDWPDSVEFHREMVEAQMKLGRLRMLKICMGSLCIGYEYAYKLANTYVHFLNSRTSSHELERISIGKVNFCELVKKAIEDNVNLINSLRGKYEYKMRMGGISVPIHVIFVVRRGLLINLRIRIFKWLSWLLNICYYKIWFSRIAPKLPWRPRTLLNLWIRTSVFVD
jgi:hypothetical protein